MKVYCTEPRFSGTPQNQQRWSGDELLYLPPANPSLPRCFL